MRVLDAGCDLEAVVESGQAVVVIGEGDVAGDAAAALLLSDYAVLRPGATLRIDTPQAWAGALWRLGPDAIRLCGAPAILPAVLAFSLGLCDRVGEFSLAGRSEAALDSAAVLLSRRGGDLLERAEFARLFAAGVPREGLTAFLEKRSPRFSE